MPCIGVRGVHDLESQQLIDQAGSADSLWVQCEQRFFLQVPTWASLTNLWEAVACKYQVTSPQHNPRGPFPENV